MISVHEAKEIIVKHTQSKPPVLLPLAGAFGKILAEEVYAIMDIPAFDQSNVDGYAIRFGEHNNPLNVIGEMAAGTTHQLNVTEGEAARIFTGGPMPFGADTVVMQEDTVLENNQLLVLDKRIAQGNQVRLKGAEIKTGVLAMTSGTLLTPAAIGFLAGIGIAEVSVYNAPKVAILSTGNELQTPGRPLAFGQVYESNALILQAALSKMGVKDIQSDRVADKLDSQKAAINKALADSDILLLTGGVSVGDYDFVPTAAGACGVTTHFHKIKQRPGKPLFFGTKDDRYVFGLPGNPSSALTCFYEYVLPMIEGIMHLPSSVSIQKARLTAAYKKVPGLTHFLKGHFENGRATPLSAQESFKLSAYAHANCLIVLDEDRSEYQQDEEVDVHLLP